MVRIVPREVSEETLRADIERYKEIALELGASACEIIPADWVSVDERVRLKCFVPRCYRVGESPNCPPYTPGTDEVRRALIKYQWAILFKINVEPLSDYLPSQSRSPSQRRQVLFYHRKTNEVVCELEGLAFRDGYYLAMGFGGGSCKDYLCNGLVCQFLDSGRCRLPLRARPAMEAMGINVFELITRVGWEVYPLTYAEEDPSSIPCAISVGIVFIH